MNRLSYVTRSNDSTEYKIFTLSIFILFIYLSSISIFVMHNWLRDVVWSWDMIWDTIRVLKYDLSRQGVETLSESRHKTDKISNNIRRKRDKTRNI